MNIIKKTIPTSNYQVGRTRTITKIVIHWMAGTLAGAQARFTNPTSSVSAHYGIEDDNIYQWVDEKDTAFHAGNFTVNQESIGIEHSAHTDRPASEDTYKNAGELVGAICKRWKIPLDREHIIKHSQIKATQCPGTMDLDKIISIAKSGIIPVMDADKTRAIQNLDNYRQVRPVGFGSSYEGFVNEIIGNDKDIANVKKSLIEAQLKIKQLEAQLASTPIPVPGVPSTSLTKKDIADLLRDLAKLAEA